MTGAALQVWPEKIQNSARSTAVQFKEEAETEADTERNEDLPADRSES